MTQLHYVHLKSKQKYTSVFINLSSPAWQYTITQWHNTQSTKKTKRNTTLNEEKEEIIKTFEVLKAHCIYCFDIITTF